MRNKNQVGLPIDLEICIPKEDFVFNASSMKNQSTVKSWA